MSNFIEVKSPNVTYSDTEIISKFQYQSTLCTKGADGKVTVVPNEKQLLFKTLRKPAKTGVMLIGLGGNNGSTVTAAILANKHNVTWRTKKGEQKPNYFGSVTQASTVRVGMTADREEVHVPMKDIVPMVNPNDIVVGGWDCSSMNLADAMVRAQVLDVTLQEKLAPLMKDIVPKPAIFDLEFVALNQQERADNIISGTKQEAVDQVRKDIREFKATNGLDTVIVLWTANTERFTNITTGVHDTADNILKALENNENELAPSACYAIAAILEGCSYINGAPQNTNVPAIIDLAKRHGVFIGGDDFKSGQTKMKSALIEFFVGAGIKPECIASYNHLGNNDGKNLNAPAQFRSKEISKANVVDDMVASNDILFPDGKGPDHCIVIKYLPYVADSKRALDEYTFSIFMGGEQTIVMHNTCQDSLLASPLILDLVILTELMQRVGISDDNGVTYSHMDTVLSVLSYLLKAPMVTAGTPVVNALSRQRQAIENIIKALVAIPPENNMMMECRM